MALRKISFVSANGFGIGLDNSSAGKLVFPKKYTILLLVDEIQTKANKEDSELEDVLLSLHVHSWIDFRIG